MNKKSIILISLIVFLSLAIIGITVLFIYFKEKDLQTEENYQNNSNMLNNYWSLFKQEIIENDEVISSIEINAFKLKIKSDVIEVYYYELDKQVCKTTNYVFENNILSILDSNIFLKDTYNVTFYEDIMILEKNSDIEGRVLKSYFQKAAG